MEVCRTMGAMASVVLLWAGVVSTSVASSSVAYRCQADGESYTQQVSAGPSQQVRLRSNGRLQETAPGTENNPQALADFQANGLSANCVQLSASEAASDRNSWPDGSQVARVHFAFDQAGLSDTARATLAGVVTKMRTSNQLFVVEGHTDNRGGEAYNQLLGQYRAERVAGLLADQGVAPKQLLVRSRGKTTPVAGNRKPAQQAQNRRVDIIVRRLD